MPGLVRAARVVVTSCLHVSQSRIVHLAASHGRPAVNTDVGDLVEAVGDLVEAVRDGESGLLGPRVTWRRWSA